MANKLTVNAFWDNDAGVWVATSDDVIGLVVESPDMGQLVRDLQDVIPVLLEENHQSSTSDPIELLYSGKASFSLSA